jgi:hypothetical protein
MANPTTNYGWPMPTSTDLVTDLPADFALFGQPVDTSLKALNPETTLGDIAYRSSTSNTNTRLAIGTTGQVLSVVAGVPAWSTAASGLTKVQASTFTAVANTGTTFDGVFTSTYKKYLVVFNGCISSGGVAVAIQTRVAGVSQTGNYGLSNQTDYTGGSTNVLSNNATSVNVGTWATSIGTNLKLLFTAVGNASERPAFGGIGSSGSAYGVLTVGAVGSPAAIVDGFIVTPASGTITGTITVYGLAN